MTTVTTGVNLDPDGYTAVARPQIVGRDSLSRAVGINATIIWELEPATHMVVLTGVQSNCVPSGDNPRSITIVVGDTAATTFNVNCLDQIAFASDRDRDSEIYVMSADGTGHTHLTNDPTHTPTGFSTPALVSARLHSNE